VIDWEKEGKKDTERKQKMGEATNELRKKEEENEAVAKIQRWWRMKRATRELGALIKRAKTVRCCLLTWYVRQRYQRLKKATVRIQRWWRLVSAQRKLRQLVRERRKEEDLRRKVREEQKQMDDEMSQLEQLLRTAEQRLNSLETYWKEQQQINDLNVENGTKGVDSAVAVRTLLKGEEYELKETTKRVMIGLGWDIAEGKAWDLDASVLLFKYTTHVDDVFYFKRQSNDGAISHKGDSRTGGGGSDDERIFVNLRKVTLNVNTLVMVVTVFTKEGDFSLVRNAFIRVCDVTKTSSGTVERKSLTSSTY